MNETLCSDEVVAARSLREGSQVVRRQRCLPPTAAEDRVASPSTYRSGVTEAARRAGAVPTVRSAAAVMTQGERLRPRRRSAGPAGEEAGDLVGGVSLEGIGADVAAGQGGFGAGVAQQARDVAQRNPLVEPGRAE